MKSLTLSLLVAFTMACTAFAQAAPQETATPPAPGPTNLLPAQADALRALARDKPFTWTEITPEQTKDLADKADEYLRLYQAHNLPNGLQVNLWWTDYDRSGVEAYDGCGDSVCWTGHYLAMLALKHSITRDAATLDAINAVLDKLNMLSLVSGRDGYIARYAGPASDKGYQAYYSHYGKEDPDRPGFGRRAYKGVAPYEDLVWLGRSSRDSYDGVNLGLAMTWVYVPDEQVRVKIKTLVDRVGDRLVADKFAVIDGKGEQWGATDTFKASWLRTMMTVDPERFGAHQEEYDAALKKFTDSKPRPRWDDVYFANNLAYARITAIAVLEKDPKAQDFVKGVVRNWYTNYLKDDLNAHFAAMYLLITGDTSEAARATVQGMLIDYPKGPKWVRMVDLRNDPSIEKHNDKYAEYALLVHERVPDEFQWQWGPGLLYRWDRSIPMEMPSLDVTLPYWTGRVVGAIPAP